MRDLADAALDAARSAGASYADVRIVRQRRESLRAREQRMQEVHRAESLGVGVRCLREGAWGFAASPLAGRDDAIRAARSAASAARANGARFPFPVALAPEPPHKDAWQTAMTKDPLKVPLETKADLLLAINDAALSVRGASYATSFLNTVQEERYFASTEGSQIDQQVTRLWPGFIVTARDAATGDFVTRHGDVPPFQGGYEHLEEADLPSEAGRSAEEALVKLRARPVEPGRFDLVVEPTHLWLTVHETIGHPAELDRALGAETGEAGGSFADPARAGSLRLGAEILNVTADRTTPGGLATVAYDDEGVVARSWAIVRDGILVDYATTREWALRLGQEASKGCAQADSWSSFPILRMPNISLEPSSDGARAQDLIAGVEEGFYVVGNGSWSVDVRRYSFRFGSGFARRIRAGKLAEAVRDVAYRSNALEFWNACDGIGGEATWRMGGTFFDSKGEPAQIHAVSHGTPVARFRRIEIGDAGARGGG